SSPDCAPATSRSPSPPPRSTSRTRSAAERGASCAREAAGSRCSAPGWSTPTCWRASVTTRSRSPATPSASASIGWPCCATTSTTCVRCSRTTSGSWSSYEDLAELVARALPGRALRRRDRPEADRHRPRGRRTRDARPRAWRRRGHGGGAVADFGKRSSERVPGGRRHRDRSEEHTSELQSPYDLVCRLLLEKKKKT